MEFEEWLKSNLTWLSRLATALCGADVAEDIAQDVAIKVERRWRTIRDLDHPRAYIRRMVVNEHPSLRRRLRRAIPAAFIGVEEIAVRRDVDPAPADQHADRAELTTEIWQPPPRQRAVIVLRYFEDLDDGEIAEALGCGQSTVRSHAARALAALRVQLTNEV